MSACDMREPQSMRRPRISRSLPSGAHSRDPVAHPASCSSERHEIVLADSLQHEKYRGRVARIGDEVWALWGDREGLAPRQTHLFLRLLEKEADCSFQDIESVVDIVVIMPRHLLGRAYLELGDAKARPRSVIGSTLDLV